MSAHWDRLPSVVGGTGAATLRRFRDVVDGAFPGRLRAAILFGSRARKDCGPNSDWDIAVFIDGLDRSAENRRLHLVAVPFNLEGFPLSPVGLPTNRQGVSPKLLASIAQGGVPVSRLRGLTFEEFAYWQRDEPDLHELVDGQPVRMTDTKQASRRETWALLAATMARGGDNIAGRRYLERPCAALGGAARDVAAKDWRGLVRVLRLLEEFWPDCTGYNPDTAPLVVGCWSDSLLREAERIAALEAGRR
jgi:predicted nucleotidyltransferase